MESAKEELKINSIEYVQFTILLTFLYMRLFGGFGSIGNYISAFLFLIWFFIAFLFSTKILSKTIWNIKYFCLFVFSIFFFLPQLIIGISLLRIVHNYFAVFFVITPFIITDYYVIRYGNSFFKYSTPIIIFSWVISSVWTLYTVTFVPKAARYLSYGSSAANIEHLDELRGFGGGYGLAYSLILVIPVIAYKLKLSKVFKLKDLFSFIYLILTLLFAYTVIKSDFGLAFIFLVIGLIAVILFKIDFLRKFESVLIAMLIVIAILMSAGTFGDLLVNSSKLFEGSMISLRIERLGQFFHGTISWLEITSRNSLNLISVNTFLKQPLLGASVAARYDIFVLRNMYIGNHSDFFDTLARYGLLAGLPLILFYYFSFKKIIGSFTGSKDRLLLYFCATLFFVISLVNYVLVFSISLVVSIVIPGIILSFNKNNQKYKALNEDITSNL